jgi:hypothetical protein
VRQNRRIRRRAIKLEWVVHPFCFDLLDGVCASATQCRRRSEICKGHERDFFLGQTREDRMSARNGNRSRFHLDRRRKLRHRQRIQKLINALKPSTAKKDDAKKATA